MITRTDDCIVLTDADDEGFVRGSCILSPMVEGVTNGDLFLFNLAVKPDHRKQGIGTAIVKAAQQVARQRRSVAIFLEPAPYLDKLMLHRELVKWYRRLGFEWDLIRDPVYMVWRPSD